MFANREYRGIILTTSRPTSPRARLQVSPTWAKLWAIKLRRGGQRSCPVPLWAMRRWPCRPGLSKRSNERFASRTKCSRSLKAPGRRSSYHSPFFVLFMILDSILTLIVDTAHTAASPSSRAHWLLALNLINLSNLSNLPHKCNQT